MMLLTEFNKGTIEQIETQLHMKAKEVISKYRPCSDSLIWLGDKTVTEMVNDCHRGDWLLWIGKRSGIDIRKLTLAKGLIAQQVEHLMRDQRSKDAVKAAIDFGNGEIEIEQLDAAADAAYAAYAAADAAAYAAAYAAADADAAAYAAYAAAARKKSLLSSADICRTVFGKELIEILSA